MMKVKELLQVVTLSTVTAPAASRSTAAVLMTKIWPSSTMGREFSPWLTPVRDYSKFNQFHEAISVTFQSKLKKFDFTRTKMQNDAIFRAKQCTKTVCL